MSAVGGVAIAGRRWWDGGWECLLGLQRASLGLPVPSSPPPGTPALATPASLLFCTLVLAPFVSSPSCIPFPWSAGPSPSTAHPALLDSPVALCSLSPCASLVAVHRPERTWGCGAEQTRVSLTCWEESREHHVGFWLDCGGGWGSGVLPFSEKQERPGVFLPEPGALLGLA